MSQLVWVYCGQEKWAEAEELQMHVYQTTRRVLGEEHPDTLASETMLAMIRARIAGGDRDDELIRSSRE